MLAEGASTNYQNPERGIETRVAAPFQSWLASTNYQNPERGIETHRGSTYAAGGDGYQLSESRAGD